MLVKNQGSSIKFVKIGKVMFDVMLMKAIRCLGTEQAMARALGVTRQNVNYWKNNAASIPYRHLLEI